MTIHPAAWRTAVAVTVASCLLYVFIAPRGAPWGDGADIALRAVIDPIATGARDYPLQTSLVAAVHALGVAPGLAGIIVASLGSALAVGANVFVARRCLRLGAWAVAAAGAAMLVCHANWVSAVDGEVYGLLGFQAAAALGVILAPAGGRRLFVAGLLLGASFLHHRIGVAVAGVALVAAVWTDGPAVTRAGLRRAAAGLAVGLVPTIAIVVVEASQGVDVLAFAFVREVLVGVAANASGVLHSTRPFGASAVYLLQWVLFDTGGIVALLAAVGAPLLFRRCGLRRATALGAFALVALVVPLRFDGVGDRHVFLTPLYLLLALAAATAVDRAGEWSRRAQPALAAAVVLVPLGLFAWVATGARPARLLPALTHDAARDFLLPLRAADPGSGQWCRRLLDGMPPGATLYGEWGVAAALELVQAADATRRDVTIVRGPPSRSAVRLAGASGVLVATMPIWAEPEARLRAMDVTVERIAPDLYRVAPAH